MAVQKEDLGLSLSLGFAHGGGSDDYHSNRNRRSSLQLNLVPSLASSAPSSHFTPIQKTFWNDCLPSSDRISESCRAGEVSLFIRGIDVNRPPPNTGDEEAGVSSPNSTISSVSGKRSERENNGGDDHEIERTSSGGISDVEDGDASRKKLRLSKDQSAILEESFKDHNTLNPKQKMALAKRLGLRPRQVEVWFQNRRARTKLKQTEVDCEFLKRYCEQLTDENRRLQKEVVELRALKLSPQFYAQMSPPTTLTMCTSCERVTVAPSSTAARRADSRVSPVDPAQSHPVHANPWTAGPAPIRRLEALRPRP
ncbi:hypothetical protein Nepgr_030762 [Nepenthes gracilis]|uniref:Homeobox domain-containing protein n=1 Tax=Nepenthes gracilis TaxID=150966 RepID=A0AAD3Y6D4_NEPGR|nr:hypothetical protein Nepgr_030762 [Nepenthes gracilis]